MPAISQNVPPAALLHAKNLEQLGAVGCSHVWAVQGTARYYIVRKQASNNLVTPAFESIKRLDTSFSPSPLSQPLIAATNFIGAAYI